MPIIHHIEDKGSKDLLSWLFLQVPIATSSLWRAAVPFLALFDVPSLTEEPSHCGTERGCSVSSCW